MNGFTFYFCVGKYGGWKFEFDGPALRLVCGWIAIVFALRDIEQDMQTLVKAANKPLDLTTKSSGKSA